jgi:hypothetical protein
VRWAAVCGLIAWVLSLGERLHVAGTETGLPMPYLLFTKLPVLHNMVAVRYSLYVVLLSALVLAVGLDRLHASGRLRPRVALPVALLCVVPLVPAWPYSYQEADAPPYFSSSAVEALPEGAVALTFPVPRFPASEPMLWQAQAGFRYRSVGGYAYTPTEDGRGTFAGGITAWERVVSQAPAGRLGRVAPAGARRAAARDGAARRALGAGGRPARRAGRRAGGHRGAGAAARTRSPAA